MLDVTQHDDDTMGRVYKVLMENGHSQASASDVVSGMQNAGVLFRERVEEGVFYITTEDPNERVEIKGDTINLEQPTEWIERQEEERRAWAVTTSVETLRYADQWTAETVVDMAGKIEAFVKGPEPEDPDLHDQESLDQFYVSYVEHSAEGLEYLATVPGVMMPDEEEVAQAATNLLDSMTKAGVRLKSGKTFDEVLKDA